VRTLAALSVPGALGRRRASTPATWTLEDSIRETSAWPASVERDKRLYNLYLAAGRDDEARAALGRLAERLPAAALPDPEEPLVPFGDALPQSAYGSLVERIREVVRASVPSGSKVIGVSKGDPRLVDLGGRQAWHFPQDERGSYAGHYPADSDNAIAQLEQLRARGGDYLLLPSTASWWLDHYDGFARHLERHYRLVRRGEPCQIFDLSGGGAGGER
jgi:hypothetical protein